MHRPRTGSETRCAEGQPVARRVEGHRAAEARGQSGGSEVQVTRSGIASTEGGRKRAAGETVPCEGEQAHSAETRERVALAVVAAGPDRQPVTDRVERDGIAQEIEVVQGGSEVDIVRAGVASADGRGEGAAGETGVGEGEQPDRAGQARDIAEAAIVGRPDRQPVAGRVQRNRPAESVAGLQGGSEVDIVRAGIAAAKRGGERTPSEAGVSEGEQPHRAGIGGHIAEAVVAKSPDGQPVPGRVQRDGLAEEVAGRQRGPEVEIVSTRVASADGRRERAAGEAGVGEGKQPHRARGSGRIPEAAVDARPDRETIARRIQRNGPAELIVGLQGRPEVEIVSARIAPPDCGRERPAAKAGVGEGEEPHRTGVAPEITEAVVAVSPHREPVAGRVQRDGNAEDVVALQSGSEIEIVAAWIAPADPRRERAAGEVGVAEGEQPHRAGINERSKEAVVLVRPHRQPVPGRIQRDGLAEPVVELERCTEVEVVSPCVASADGGRERTAGEAGVGEGEQAHRAGVGDRVGCSPITARPHRQPVPGRVQRDGDAEEIKGLERGAEVEIVPAGIAPADGGRERAAGETGVREGEQPHRADAVERICSAPILVGSDRQPVPGRVQRDGDAEDVVDIQRGSQIAIVSARVSPADRGREGTASEAVVAEGEQPHRTGVAEGVARAVVTDRPDRQPVPGRVQRDGVAEKIIGLQGGSEVQVVHARVAPADGGRERAAGETGVRKGEQPHRTGTAEPIAEAVVTDRPDRQPVPGRVQGDGVAEAVAGRQRGPEVQIVSTRVAPADRGREHAAAEAGVGEGEQPHRAGQARDIAEAVVTGRPDRQPVPGRVQRDGGAEGVAVLQGGAEVDVASTVIAPAQGRRERAAGEAGVGEGVQPHRAGVGERIAEAVILGRPDRQPVPGRVQRDGSAERVAVLQGDSEVDVVAAGIAPADGGRERAAPEAGVAEGEQSHRAGTAGDIAEAAVALRPDRQPVSGRIQRDGGAEQVEVLQGGSEVEIVSTRIAPADRGRERAAGEAGVAEGEQPHRAGNASYIAEAVVGVRPDRQPVPGGVQRNGLAEPITGLQSGSEVEVAAAGIAPADGGRERAAPEAGVAEGEQRHGAGSVGHIADTGVVERPDRQPVPGRVQRNGGAERFAVDYDGPGIEVVRTGIAPADGRRERTAPEAGVGEREQPHRAGVGNKIAEAVVLGRPDRQPVPGRVQRDGIAEGVVGLQGGAEVDVVAASIASADRGRECAAAEAGVGEGEQTHPAGIEGHSAEAVVAHRPDRQPVARRVQRYGASELVEGLESRTHVPIRRAQPRPDDPGILPGLGLGEVADDDVPGVQQQAAARAGVDARQIDIAQRLLARDLDPAAAATTGGQHRAQHGRQVVGPDHGRPALPSRRGDIDADPVVDEGGPGIGQGRQEAEPALVRRIVGPVHAIGRAALEGPADADQPAQGAARGVDLRRQQAHRSTRQIDPAAIAQQARGQIDARGRQVAARRDADDAAVQAARRVVDRALDLRDRAARGIGQLTADTGPSDRGDLVRQTERARCPQRYGTAVHAARGVDRSAHAEEATRDLDRAAVQARAARGVDAARDLDQTGRAAIDGDIAQMHTAV